MALPQLPEVQKEWQPPEEEEESHKFDLKELTDPTVQEEEAYEDSLQEKQEQEADDGDKEEQ
jgi:hypothetical protein